jgi:hypothetical protein
MKWLLILAVCVAGCADEAPPTVPTSPGSGIGVGGGTAGTGGAGGAGGAGGGGGVGGGSVGACDNEDDLQAIEDEDSTMRDVARDCGEGKCLIFFSRGPEYESCVHECVKDNVPDLSVECAACYGASERCSHDSLCTLRCRNDTCSVTCLDCMTVAGCIEELEACSGLPGNGCPNKP